MDKKICGVDGIIRYDFKRIGFVDDEWYIETTGGSFSNIIVYQIFLILRKLRQLRLGFI